MGLNDIAKNENTFSQSEKHNHQQARETRRTQAAVFAIRHGCVE